MMIDAVVVGTKSNDPLLLLPLRTQLSEIAFVMALPVSVRQMLKLQDMSEDCDGITMAD